jgi:hypothetical protein
MHNKRKKMWVVFEQRETKVCDSVNINVNLTVIVIVIVIVIKEMNVMKGE